MGLKLALLRKRAKETAKDLAYYRNEIEKRETDRLLPSLKKKYEGKYFIYNNGFSSSDRWNLYVYCKEVKDTNYCIVNTFETDSGGQSRFHINKHSSLYLLEEQQINKSVYDAALKKFYALAAKLSETDATNQTAITQ